MGNITRKEKQVKSLVEEVKAKAWEDFGSRMERESTEKISKTKREVIPIHEENVILERIL